MLTKLAIVGGLGVMVRGVLGQAGAYQQCGGQGFSGPTTCVSGYTCTEVSAPFYSQCLPGGNGGTAATPTTPGGATGTSSAPGTISTLVPGNSFIRGVEAPFFHFYLQSEVLGTASDAVLGDWKTAAQFQVTGGQLIQNPQGTKLYAQVAAYNSGDVKLKVTWSETPGTFGSFVFSGDTLEWSDPSVKRAQNNAWLICADAAGHNDVYLNLGPYSYNTPAGCGDQTIHAYTGATPTP